jgi:hypothetical protein
MKFIEDEVESYAERREKIISCPSYEIPEISLLLLAISQ